jgi:imidazolonepropionase-like amidohydrolase
MQVSTRGINAGPKFLGVPGITIPAVTANIEGNDEARAAVREQLHYGADWIKIFTTAGYTFTPAGEIWVDPTLTLGEIETIVDEAHRHHHPVACHAYGGEGLKNCIVAGVDSIEHGEGLDDSEITMMLQKGIYFEPTLYRYCMPVAVDHDNALSGGKNSLCEMSKKTFRAVLARGVKISFGSGVDGNPYLHGTNATEFVAMVQDGMTPVQAILSSVKVAAEMMGWQGEIGSIEKGKYADIIAVSGNPLEDITELERVKFVMKGGKVIRNDWK